MVDTSVTDRDHMTLAPSTIGGLHGLKFRIIVRSNTNRTTCCTSRLCRTTNTSVTGDDTRMIARSRVVAAIGSLPTTIARDLAANRVIINVLSPCHGDRLSACTTGNIATFTVRLLPHALSHTRGVSMLSSRTGLTNCGTMLLTTGRCSHPFPVFVASTNAIGPTGIIVLNINITNLRTVTATGHLNTIIRTDSLHPATHRRMRSLNNG